MVLERLNTTILFPFSRQKPNESTLTTSSFGPPPSPPFYPFGGLPASSSNPFRWVVVPHFKLDLVAFFSNLVQRASKTLDDFSFNVKSLYPLPVHSFVRRWVQTVARSSAEVTTHLEEPPMPFGDAMIVRSFLKSFEMGVTQLQRHYSRYYSKKIEKYFSLIDSCRDINGDTVIHRAADEAVLQWFLSRPELSAFFDPFRKEGLDPRIYNHAGLTPFHLVLLKVIDGMEINKGTEFESFKLDLLVYFDKDKDIHSNGMLNVFLNYFNLHDIKSEAVVRNLKTRDGLSLRKFVENEFLKRKAMLKS